MRILHFAPGFTPEIGSMRIHHELAKGLVKIGDEVVLVTCYPRPYNLAPGHPSDQYNRRKIIRERVDGIDVIRVPSILAKERGLLSYALEQIFLPVSFFFGSLAAGKCDIVYTTVPPQGCSILALLLSRIRRIPALLTVHDLHPKILVELGLLKNKIAIRILSIIERMIYWFASHLGVNSRGNKLYIMSRGTPGDRISVLPQWADLDEIHVEDRNNEIRAELSEQLDQDLSSKFILSFTGIMSYPQDLESIIDAAARFKDNPDILFLMVGNGPKEQLIKDRAKEHGLENVVFWPLQPKQKYFRILSASDVCFVPLKKEVPLEQVPSKLLEIMGSGRPVILNAPRGDAAKILEDGNAGFNVLPGEIDKLVKIIEDLYRNPEKCKQLGLNGREYIEQHYSLIHCAKLFHSRFQRLIDKRHEKKRD